MELRMISGHTLAQSFLLPVEYVPFRLDERHVYIGLRVGGEFVGYHLGERSGRPLLFVRMSDARRFCNRRNKAERARVQGLESNSKAIRKGVGLWE